MKVMIEINLPEGQKIPTSDDILRLTSPWDILKLKN